MQVSPINSSLKYYNQKTTFKSNVYTDKTTKSYGLKELSADVMCVSFLASHLDFKEYINGGTTVLNKISRTILCVAALSYGLFELRNQLKPWFES